MTEIFEVGGCVRDEIMGIKPKDIDFSVVAPSFEDVVKIVTDEGMKIVQIKPDFGTVIAVARKPFRGHKGGLDFVWARVDGPSSDGRRPDWTRPGTLRDDIMRRDFTMNALAKDEQGNIIDLVGGVKDIEAKVIETVGHPLLRFREDSLRVLRAMRFSITKGFDISQRTRGYMQEPEIVERLVSVSKERQREEMEKMFAHDTIASLRLMEQFPKVRDAVFRDGLRLSATMKG